MIRRLIVVLALASSLVVAACGNEQIEEGDIQSENAQLAETEGIYVTVDGLKYQVQMSKQLNPLDKDDKSYLEGVSPREVDLQADEEWFAVFLLAQNYAEPCDEGQTSTAEKPCGTIQSASDFEIVDTQDNKYTPIVIADTNVWAYKSVAIPPKTGPLPNEDPDVNSPARERFPNGAMLLFKLKRPSIDNRPLELNIRGTENDAIVNLDV